MFNSFKKMPLALKFLTGMALFCILLLFKALIPGMFGTFSYNGEVLEYSQIWERGFGVPLILVGCFMPMAGMSLLLRLKFSRHFYCCTVALTVLTPTLLAGNYYSLAFFAIIPSAITVYLFTSNKVRWYYGT
ncbi:hypothetical protein [Aliiglaciecola lipolytica]|uniref:hypothetical protein n=1 Tax=Aliiglaciecola lipolytica TaxID=477689 RepID=UPI001C0A150E|nr:hypothetical protein [Aliiglaciecola lipolytica]MBU2877135.1 hypothetical protein [Aliiglaciecola lipolytica]